MNGYLTFPFGAHKGAVVEAVCESNPGYVLWFHENVRQFDIPEDLVKYAIDIKIRHERLPVDDGNGRWGDWEDVVVDWDDVIERQRLRRASMTDQPPTENGTLAACAPCAEPTDQAAQSVTPEQGKGENRVP